MKITTRERVMLGLLAIVGIIALSYYFIIKPQTEKITQLTLEDIQLTQEVQMVKAELATIGNLETEIKTIDEQVQKKTERFYPVVLQDRFIILFDQLITDTGVTCSAITYSEPLLSQIPVPVPLPGQAYPLKDLAGNYKAISEKPADGSVQNVAPSPDTQAAQQTAALTPTSETMTVTLQIRSTYTRWMSLLKKIESLDRTVIVQNLVLADDNTGILAGNIMVNIYAIPKLQDQDEEYLEWPFTGKYGKTNPFVR